MKLTIFGSGYVGLVTGACFADFGNDVTLVDVDAAKVARLKEGHVPIYEPGLEEMVQRNYGARRLAFTTDAATGLAGTEIIFCCVGTPEATDGTADLRFVEQVARTVAEEFKNRKEPALFVLKSTVPVGTADRCRAILPKQVSVVNNPEFLKEGSAVGDFLRPERVIIGSDHSVAREVMTELYRPFVRTGAPILCMSNRSAEISKYAANAFLALKVSFINDLALFCEKAGGDIYDVRSGMTTDSRIGNKFLHPGSGYGGSCFPKDVAALAATARQVGHPLSLIEATGSVNERQKDVIPGRALAFFKEKGLKKAHVALWGVAFKPETDDIRESPALRFIDQLCADGHQISAYDPKAGDSLRRERRPLVEDGHLRICGSAHETLTGADALVVMTEWNEFRSPDFKKLAEALAQKVVFDGKNIYRAQSLARYGLKHVGIGFGG